MFGLAVCSVVVIGSGGALLTSARSSAAVEQDERLFARARSLLIRISSLPFGSPDDPLPTRNEIEALLSDHGSPTSVTLAQLANARPNGTWGFRDPNPAVPGRWTIVVDRDLDHDDEVLHPAEASGRLFRIRVLFEGRELLATIRGLDRETRT